MIVHGWSQQTCARRAGGGEVIPVVTSGPHCEATRILWGSQWPHCYLLGGQVGRQQGKLLA